MSNYFKYPEVEIGNVMYIMYQRGDKTYYFKDNYKVGFDNLSNDKLTEFADFIFEVRKSKFNIEEQFLIKTGVV